MTTHINNNLGGSGNLGWGLGDDAYHHTNARPAALPAATQQIASTPQEQLLRLQSLLRQESQGRGMTLSALSRFYSDTIAAYQNDSGSDTRFARTSAQSQQNLAEIQQLLRGLSRNAEYRSRLQPLLVEFDNIQGYLELEETLRSGTSFLGRDTFEKLGVFINMGASLAGRAGSLAGMVLGFRGNATLAMASGLANAWFQNGLHLTHAYGQGRDFTNKEIAGELGDSAISAMACSLLSVGLGSIRGSTKWWSVGLFAADVMCEFVISEASPVKHLLGLETRGLRHGWKAYAYGVVANALGEILGDGAGHLVQSAGGHAVIPCSTRDLQGPLTASASMEILNRVQDDKVNTSLSISKGRPGGIFIPHQSTNLSIHPLTVLPLAASALGIAAVTHTNELIQFYQTAASAALEVFNALKMPLMMAASMGLMGVVQFQQSIEMSVVKESLLAFPKTITRSQFEEFYKKLRAAKNVNGANTISKYDLLVKAAQRLDSKDCDLVFQRLSWMLNATVPIAKSSITEKSEWNCLKGLKVEEAHALLALHALTLLLPYANINNEQRKVLAELLPKLASYLETPSSRITELVFKILEADNVKKSLQNISPQQNPLFVFFVNLLPILAEGQRAKLLRTLFEASSTHVLAQDMLFDAALKLTCSAEEKLTLLEFILPHYKGKDSKLLSRTFDQLNKLHRFYQDKGGYTMLSQKFLTVYAFLGRHPLFTDKKIQTQWMQFVTYHVLPSQQQEALRLIDVAVESDNFHLPENADLLSVLAESGVDHSVLQNLAAKIYNHISKYNQKLAETFVRNVFEAFPSWGRGPFAATAFASVLLATNVAGAYPQHFHLPSVQQLSLIASISEHLPQSSFFLVLAMAAFAKMGLFAGLAKSLTHLFDDAEIKLKRRRLRKALQKFQMLKNNASLRDSTGNLTALSEILKNIEEDYSEFEENDLFEMQAFLTEQLQTKTAVSQTLENENLAVLQRFVQFRNLIITDHVDLNLFFLRHASHSAIYALTKKLEVLGSENSECGVRVLNGIRAYLNEIADGKVSNLSLSNLAHCLRTFKEIQGNLEIGEDYSEEQSHQDSVYLFNLLKKLDFESLKGSYYLEELKPLITLLEKFDFKFQELLFNKISNLLNRRFSSANTVKSLHHILKSNTIARILKINLLKALLKGSHASSVVNTLNDCFWRINSLDVEIKPTVQEVAAWFDLVNFTLENNLLDQKALDYFKIKIHPSLIKALEGVHVSEELVLALGQYNQYLQVKEFSKRGGPSPHEPSACFPIALSLAATQGHMPSWSAFALAAAVATVIAISEHKKPKKKKVVVVGAGLAGLFAAYHMVNKSAEELEVEILEANEHEVGGKVAPSNEGAQFLDDYEGNPLIEFVKNHPEFNIKLKDAGDYDVTPFQLADGSELSAEDFLQALNKCRAHALESLEKDNLHQLDQRTAYEWINSVPDLSERQQEAMRGRLRIEEGTSDIAALSLCINLARSKDLKRRFEVVGGMHDLVLGLRTFLESKGVQFTLNSHVIKINRTDENKLSVSVRHQVARLCDAVIMAVSPENLQADHIGRPAIKFPSLDIPWQRMAHLKPASIHKANLHAEGVKKISDAASAHWAHWTSSALGEFNKLFASVFHGISGDALLGKQELREMVFEGMHGKKNRKDAEGHKIKVNDRAWDGNIGPDGVRHAYTTMPHPGRALGIVKMALRQMLGVYNEGRVFFANHVMGLGCYTHNAAEAGLNIAEQALTAMGLNENPQLSVAPHALLGITEEEFKQRVSEGLLEERDQKNPLLDRFHKLSALDFLTEWVAEGRKFHLIDLRSKNEKEEQGEVIVPHQLYVPLELKAHEKESEADPLEWNLEEWEQRFEKLHLNPDVPVVFLCSGGQRSFFEMRKAMRLHEQRHPKRYAGEYFSLAGGVYSLLMQLKTVLSSKELQRKVILKPGEQFYRHKGQRLAHLSALYELQQRLFRGEEVREDELPLILDAMIKELFTLRWRGDESFNDFYKTNQKFVDRLSPENRKKLQLQLPADFNVKILDFAYAFAEMSLQWIKQHSAEIKVWVEQVQSGTELSEEQILRVKQLEEKVVHLKNEFRDSLDLLEELNTYLNKEQKKYLDFVNHSAKHCLQPLILCWNLLSTLAVNGEIIKEQLTIVNDKKLLGLELSEAFDFASALSSIVIDLNYKKEKNENSLEYYVFNKSHGVYFKFLTDILTNLISNAKRYGNKGQKVHTEWIAGEGLQITVSDKGIGIKAENISRLGQEGFREARKEVAGSTGYGLSSVIALLSQLAWGPLAVKSKEGEGSSFRFLIPARFLVWTGERAEGKHLSDEESEFDLERYLNRVREERFTVLQPRQ